MVKKFGAWDIAPLKKANAPKNIPSQNFCQNGHPIKFNLRPGSDLFKVGVCGGWILAKSQEICSTSRHKTPWQFFNEGQLYADETFRLVEKCQFNQDFPVFVSTVSTDRI